MAARHICLHWRPRRVAAETLSLLGGDTRSLQSHARQKVGDNWERLSLLCNAYGQYLNDLRLR